MLDAAEQNIATVSMVAIHHSLAFSDGIRIHLHAGIDLKISKRKSKE